MLQTEALSPSGSLSRTDTPTRDQPAAFPSANFAPADCDLRVPPNTAASWISHQHCYCYRTRNLACLPHSRKPAAILCQSITCRTLSAQSTNTTGLELRTIRIPDPIPIEKTEQLLPPIHSVGRTQVLFRARAFKISSLRTIQHITGTEIIQTTAATSGLTHLQDVGRSMVIPALRPHKCRQSLPTGLLHHHVQRS